MEIDVRGMNTFALARNDCLGGIELGLFMVLVLGKC